VGVNRFVAVVLNGTHTPTGNPAGNVVTTCGYDRDGNLISVVDAGGHVTTTCIEVQGHDAGQRAEHPTEVAMGFGADRRKPWPRLRECPARKQLKPGFNADTIKTMG
jgi:hypothetical protein